MKIDNPRVTQLLFYMLMAEIIVGLINPHDPLIDRAIMTWVGLATVFLLLTSIVYFFLKKKKSRA